MKNFIKNIIRVLPLLLCFCALAQVKKYTPANAHSHNDYLNTNPFYLAYDNGFGSIEADVFPVNGVLLVAHHKKDLQADRSLENLYIKPLLQKVRSASKRNLSLLVDIKENYALALALLIKELEPLKPFLSAPGKRNYLTIIISGERPAPSDYKNYPAFIFFDDDLKLRHTVAERKRVGLVSLPFNSISTWNGEGNINEEDKKKLKHVIDSTHALGKPIRFWAAPETEASWKWQMKLHADLIGTDKIGELGGFLRSQNISKHAK